MTRKSRIKPKEPFAVSEITGNYRFDIVPILFESSPIPAAVLEGPNHILRYVNPTFCQLVGKSKDELTGKPFAGVSSWKGCLALLDRVYNTGEVKIQIELDRTEAPSAHRLYTMWPIGGRDGPPAGVMMLVSETTQSHQLAIAMNEQLLLSGVRQHELRETAERLNVQLQHEIADRERLERALVKSEKLAVTARFALSMAHEINNPLAAITNLVFLLPPFQTSPEARTYIATIEDQLRGLSRITAHALKFHRDSNKPTEFRLDGVLREVSGFYRTQAEKQGVVVHQRFETEGAISAFRSEIVQVVTNLLLNALDATPAGGQVILHLYAAPRWLCEIHASTGYCLSIADTGSGVAPQDRARIYQPFFTTKGERGTGLGLWVSAGIVDRIGGSIRVWSTCRPGRSGTCFSVFLPAGQDSFSGVRRRRRELTELQHSTNE
jgi:signal transduction histidine kinase